MSCVLKNPCGNFVEFIIDESYCKDCHFIKEMYTIMMKKEEEKAKKNTIQFQYTFYLNIVSSFTSPQSIDIVFNVELS